MSTSSFFSTLRKKSVLLFLAFLFVLFNLLLNYFLPAEQALDLKFAYSVDQAYLALGSLSKSDLALYKMGLLALDFPYLIVYGLLTTGVLLVLWESKKLTVVPLIIVLFDFFENILIIKLINNFPTQKPIFAWLASFCTTSKWIFIGLFLFLLLVGISRMIRLSNKSISSFFK
ncbi:hypothetical protein JYB64_13595 [Algoriphagus aestuarii]|nr:hypothetical protein [Algoriphagus aestuarii]